MHDTRFIRLAGLWCIVGGVIAASGAVITALVSSAVPLTDLSAPYTPAVFRLTEVIWTIAHLFMFIGTLGFARSGAIGASRVWQPVAGRVSAGYAVAVENEETRSAARC